MSININPEHTDNIVPNNEIETNSGVQTDFEKNIYKIIGLTHEENNENIRLVEIDILDKIYFLYSDRGANLSDKEIIGILRISSENWDEIKKKLGITKESDVASPFTMKKFGENEEMIQKYLIQTWDNYYDYQEKKSQTIKKKNNNLFSSIKGFFTKF